MDTIKRIELYYQKCKNAKVISFDVFDTIIVRDIVNPDDVFSIVDKMQEDNKAVPDSINFESLLLECELSLVHPVHQMIFLMKKLKKEGKIIVLTSDMYLNAEMMQKLLHHVGMKKGVDYDQLFVSSEYSCSKKDGGLYKQLLKAYDLKPSDVVHFGDALRSDYFIPQKMGIKAVWIKSFPEIIRKLGPYKEIDTLNRFITNHTMMASYEYKIGYECFGPLLYGFTLWLEKRISNCDSHFYFLSREGHLFLRALEIIGSKLDNTHYMLISRRSITGALLWTYDDIDTMLQSLGIEREITFTKILSLLGLDNLIDDERLEEIKENIYSSAQEIMNDKKAYSFIQEHSFEVVERSKQQFEGMSRYFDSIDFNNSSDCAIVDIGWLGSMQCHINRYLDIKQIEKRITGLYLGVHHNAFPDAKEGFLFNGESVKKQRDLFAYVGFLESVLSEQNGSVKRYYVQNDSFKIERCDYEYNEDDTKKITEIQKGMLAFVADMHKSVVKNIIDFSPSLSGYTLKKVGNYPTRDELNFYSALCFTDNSYSNNSFLGMNCLRKRDFVNSIWKTAYLKCTFGKWFPAKLCYDLLYGLKRRR